MPSVQVNLAISAEDYLAHYQGQANQVVARDTNGRAIRFPSNILQPFVTHEGIHGRFVIEFDAQHKFKGITRVQQR